MLDPGHATPDPTAVERLFEDHHEMVYRAAYRVTGRAEDAEDVLQTIFVRLVPDGGPPGLWQNPGGYLRRTAVNAAIDLVRRRRDGRHVALEDAAPAVQRDERPGPDDEHAARELAQRVRSSLAGLSARSAEIFALRYFEGYGNREIARLVGTSEGSVAVILHRARHHVRAALEPSSGGAA
jgi:RNA polymerase sigma-70 factor (ECF subfamily)